MYLAKSYTVLRYRDISRVYKYFLKGIFVARKQELRAVDTYENIWTLCELNSFLILLIEDVVVKVIINHLLSKNDKIIIGDIP